MITREQSVSTTDSNVFRAALDLQTHGYGFENSQEFEDLLPKAIRAQAHSIPQ